MALNRFSEDQLDRSERSAKCACARAYVVFRFTYIFFPDWKQSDNLRNYWLLKQVQGAQKWRWDNHDLYLPLMQDRKFKMDLATCIFLFTCNILRFCCSSWFILHPIVKSNFFKRLEIRNARNTTRNIITRVRNVFKKIISKNIFWKFFFFLYLRVNF